VTDDPPGPDRLGTTLDLDGPLVLDLEAAEREPLRARADEDAVGRRGLLEARRDVHGLAGGERR
jgi:hypothetical protein